VVPLRDASASMADRMPAGTRHVTVDLAMGPIVSFGYTKLDAHNA
jgi:hypothetical protein